MGRLDEAGRQIAGLLTYNPGPGIYSRLERAIEAMPENVRVQEIPGLLKRYKEGVPGWELKATDLDEVISGRDVVPRAELLTRVKERSPVYTHGEMVFGGNPPMRRDPDEGSFVAVTHAEDALGPGAFRMPVDEAPRPLGAGIYHGKTGYEKWGQGGHSYAEILLTQPGSGKLPIEKYHWGEYGRDRDKAVAHARFDTHNDALRINELQSDLGIHNRKAREAMADFVEGQPIAKQRPAPELPFPLEDSWSDLLIKRLALEAARKGHRAIEVASPRAIADKVGGNIENYEHFYGKVVPGALERLGRKMGGLTLDEANTAVARAAEESPQYATHQVFRDQMRAATGDEQLGPNFWRLYSGMRYDSLPPAQQAITYDRFGGSHPVSQADGGTPQEMYEYLHSLGLSPEDSQRITSQALYLAPHNARAMHNFALREQLESVGQLTRPQAAPPAKRYIMSDAMRRRLIEGGIGASLLAPLLMQDGE